jgi:hypothetical protein
MSIQSSAFHQAVLAEPMGGTPGRGFVDEHVADGMFELVGGDWNHGMDYDFPFSWEWNVIIPTDFHSIIFQRGR